MPSAQRPWRCAARLSALVLLDMKTQMGTVPASRAARALISQRQVLVAAPRALQAKLRLLRRQLLMALARTVLQARLRTFLACHLASHVTLESMIGTMEEVISAFFAARARFHQVQGPLVVRLAVLVHPPPRDLSAVQVVQLALWRQVTAVHVTRVVLAHTMGLAVGVRRALIVKRVNMSRGRATQDVLSAGLARHRPL